MGILAKTPYPQNCIKKTNIIPDYASEYKNEYLFIRGIDTCFEFFLDNIDKADKGIFKNNRVEIIKKKINKLDQALRLGYLSDISKIEIGESDVNHSFLLLERLADFSDYYVDDDWEFDRERFDKFVGLEFPGYKNLVECIELFQSKFKIVFDKYEINWPDSDGEIVIDSDSDSDSDGEIVNDSDSDSDGQILIYSDDSDSD